MNKNALTVLELIVVVVIMGILVAMGIPYYNNWVERTQGERAIANTELIVSAVKQYAIRYEAPPPSLPSNLTEINNLFNLGLIDINFNYSIEEITSSPTHYHIRVERNPPGSGIIILYNINPPTGNPEGWDIAPDSDGDGLVSTWQWMP